MQAACEKLKQDMLKTLGIARTIEIGVTDEHVATYAAWVEYGWEQRVTPKQQYFFARKGVSIVPKAGGSLSNPARPFFRETIATHSPTWQKIFLNYLRVYGYGSIIDALTLVGNEAKADFQETIANGRVIGGKVFERRRPLTLEMYAMETNGHKTDGSGSLETDQPLKKTGDLFNSIGWRFKVM